MAPRVIVGLFLVATVALLAACGGGGTNASGSNQGPYGGATTGERSGDDGSGASNPRVRAVLDCFQEKGGDFSNAYELESNAVTLDTETSGVELHFFPTAAKAKKLGSEIQATGIGQVFVRGTVVENWASIPTADERKPVAECLKKDPGP